MEASPPAIEAAKNAFTEYGINSASYRFINSETPGALRKFDPKAFDVVQCHGFLEQSDPRFVFQQLSRLRAKHVILDTRLTQGKGPIVRFRSRTDDDGKANGPERYKSILAIPNHELITFFCDYFQFRWRVIDWKASGITDWTGSNDYEHDRRRTYILDGSAADPAARARVVGAIKHEPGRVLSAKGVSDRDIGEARLIARGALGLESQPGRVRQSPRTRASRVGVWRHEPLRHLWRGARRLLKTAGPQIASPWLPEDDLR